MCVYPAGCRRIGFSRHQPRRAMVGVAITFVVDRNDVQKYRVPLIWPDACKGHPQSREHSPERINNNNEAAKMHKVEMTKQVFNNNV